jgi:hypothetical protein
MKLNQQQTEHLQAVLLVASAALSVAALLSTLLSGIMNIKRIRCMNTVQKSLPTIKRASELYIQKNNADDEE